MTTRPPRRARLTGVAFTLDADEASTFARVRRGKPDLSRADVFTEPWLEEPGCRWALGLFVADGTLYQPHMRPPGWWPSLCIALRLHPDDRDGVEAFVSALGLPRSRVRDGAINGRPVASVTFQSPRVARLLQLGFAPGPKSDTVRAPARVASDVDFWRGVIDGDGYTSLIRNRGRVPALHVGLRSCSAALHEQFATFVRHAVGDDAYLYEDAPTAQRSVVTGDAGVALIEMLYRDCGRFTVARKREKALRLAAERVAPTQPARLSELQVRALAQLAQPQTSLKLARLLELGNTPGAGVRARNALYGLKRRGLVEFDGPPRGHKARTWRRVASDRDALQ